MAKSICLGKLKNSVLTEIKNALTKGEAIKPLDNIISDWKQSKACTDDKLTNYTLMAKRSQTGFLGFFAGKTEEQDFIDKLSNEEDTMAAVFMF